MHSIISKLNLCIIFSVFYCTAVSHVIHSAITQPNRLSPTSRLGEPHPTCIPVEPDPQPLRATSHFDIDCLGAWADILSMEEFSYTSWRWKRFPPSETLPGGYARLPFTQVHRTCTLKLDVRARATDADDLALAELGPSLKELWLECLQPMKGLLAMGTIPVGKYHVLALTAQPSEMHLPLPALNRTAKWAL